MSLPAQLNIDQSPATPLRGRAVAAAGGGVESSSGSQGQAPGKLCFLPASDFQPGAPPQLAIGRPGGISTSSSFAKSSGFRRKFNPQTTRRVKASPTLSGRSSLGTGAGLGASSALAPASSTGGEKNAALAENHLKTSVKVSIFCRIWAKRSGIGA